MDTIVAIITGGAFLIQLGGLIFVGGRIGQKVESNGKALDDLTHELRNSYRCRAHEEMTEKVGKLEGSNL